MFTAAASTVATANMMRKEAVASTDHMTAALSYVLSFLLLSPELMIIDILHLNGGEKRGWINIILKSGLSGFVLINNVYYVS